MGKIFCGRLNCSHHCSKGVCGLKEIALNNEGKCILYEVPSWRPSAEEVERRGPNPMKI